jgi:hypothetical protein
MGRPYDFGGLLTAIAHFLKSPTASRWESSGLYG